MYKGSSTTLLPSLEQNTFTWAGIFSSQWFVLRRERPLWSRVPMVALLRLWQDCTLASCKELLPTREFCYYSVEDGGAEALASHFQ